MKASTVKIWGLFCAVFALTAAQLSASDPVGIYAIVEKVVIEPGETAPQRIQIWGAFALADGKPGDGYEQAQPGYLYYTIPAGKEEICRKEWADLKTVAGTGEGIGFGARYKPTGRIRKAGDKPETPDAYPIGFGIVKVGHAHQQPIILKGLRKALRPQ